MPKPSTAQRRLLREFQELLKDSPDGIIAAPISDDNLFQWRCVIAGPPGTCYEYGVFEARISFPKEYPLEPPSMKFTPPILHPNIYADGSVCISILHPMGDDPLQYESAEERWGPLQSIEKILLSVSSMIADPNTESGANVDACKLWRDNKEEFNRIVREQVIKSLQV